MYSCTINNTAYLIPSKWDDLTKDQLLQIVKYFYNGFSDIDIKVRLILDCCSFSLVNRKALQRGKDVLYHIKPKKGGIFYITPEQMVFLVRQLNFLSIEESNEAGDTVHALNSHLSRNLIPDFRHNLTRYHGPADRLFNLIFEEYLEAESHFRNYMQQQDIKFLDKLIATLYRPVKKRLNKKSTNYNGDPRRDFNYNLVDSYAKKLKKLSPILKFSIFLYYQGCRRFLAKNFENVYDDAPEGSKASNLGPLALIDALSGEDVTKNKTVRKTLLYDVMVRLEKAAIQKQNEK